MEKAFIVNKNSRLWNNYFISKKEKEKLINLADAFFEKYNIKTEKYGLTKRLCFEFLNKNEFSKYPEQIKKHKNFMGMWEFKKKSFLNDKWEKEVFSNIDESKLYINNCWWHGFITNGEYAMWDYKGILYGFLSAKYSKKIELSDEMEEIKISEYYKMVEDWEGKQNEI